MRIRVIKGTIKRRLLVNFRADPQFVQRLLPQPFRPKLHRGYSVVGICLIRLEQMRAAGLPRIIGFSSENAAHRVAVEWNDEIGTLREDVFIPRRGAIINPGRLDASFRANADKSAQTKSLPHNTWMLNW